MFGHNPVRAVEHGSTALTFQEIFYTIQGEGLFAGHPAVFVRMWGCHLRCFFCDTDFESNPQVMSPYAITDLVKHASRKRTSLVVLTGGEPLRQNVVPLIQLLNLADFSVQIETAGNLWLEGLEYLFPVNQASGKHNTIICSPKTPHVHPDLEKIVTAWKYIVRNDEDFSEDDGLPAESTQKRGLLQRLHRPPTDTSKSLIFLQPCDQQDEQKNLANVRRARDLCLEYGYRLSLQTHKIIGVP